MADRMKAAADNSPEESTDVKPNDQDLKEDDTELGKRKAKQTERGAEYQRDLLKSLYKSRKAGVLKQLQGIERLLQDPESIISIQEENQKLDKSFEELLETLSRLRAADISEEFRDELSKDIETVDASI